MAAKKKKGPRENLRDVDRAFIVTVMFQCGIIPMEKTDFDMRRALSQLPPEEARILKRKFRKLWRKAMREEIGNGKTRETQVQSLKAQYGVGKHVPSRMERNARKKLVFNKMWENHIEPLIEKFENPTTKTKEEIP